MRTNGGLHHGSYLLRSLQDAGAGTRLPRGPKGPYTVLWFTASADDGHKTGSAFNFTVK
jgi:hypothetical protein